MEGYNQITGILKQTCPFPPQQGWPLQDWELNSAAAETGIGTSSTFAA